MPVSGARIESNAGVTPVSTHFDGRYRIYGVAENSRLLASKGGYATKELTLALSDHHTENVGLAPVAPRPDVAGTYQLTIEASQGCRSWIPEPLITRRYTAEIRQSGASLRGSLSVADLCRQE